MHGVNHPEPRAFSYSITLLILLHVILLGVEVDLSAAVALEDMPSWQLSRGVFSRGKQRSRADNWLFWKDHVSTGQKSKLVVVGKVRNSLMMFGGQESGMC